MTSAAFHHPMCLPCVRERFGVEYDPGPPQGAPLWQLRTCCYCGRPTTYGLLNFEESDPPKHTEHPE